MNSIRLAALLAVPSLVGCDPEPEYVDISGNLFINNANDHDIAVLVRPLRTDVRLDCPSIADDPGRLLPTQAFGEAVHWVLPARTNLGVRGEGECSAAWVAGEGVPPTILFWRRHDHPWNRIPGQTFAGQRLPANAAALVFDEQGARWAGGDAFRFAVDTTMPEQPDACSPISEARLDWQAAMPRDRPLQLLALDYGPDGCFELELADLSNEDSTTSYICTPESALPFALGDHLQFRELGGGSRWLIVHRLDPVSDEIALAADGEPELRVDLLRGTGTPSTLDSLIGTRSVTVITRPSCEWTVDDACPTDERPFDLDIVDVEIEGTLTAADPTIVMVDPIDGNSGVRERELTLVHAQERALVDPTCIDGAISPGFDLDAVVISRIIP